MKYLPVFILLLTFFVSFDTYAQDDKNQKDTAQAEMIKSLVESKSFVFTAEKAYPLKGNIVLLTSGYTVMVTPSTIDCDLPYFGQASFATIDQTNVGHKFSSSSFDYQSEIRKKGSWEITMKPKDVRNGPQLYFTIQTSGATNLRINSNDRQSISYSGVIEGSK